MEIVDHEVPVRIIGPDGMQHRQHSRACSLILHQQPTRKAAKRFISAHLWLLNVAHLRFPDAAERFMRSVGGCREVQDAFLAGLRIPSSDVKGDGSMWLNPRAKIYTRVSDAIIANGLVTAAVTDETFGGQDPCKVDHRFSRLASGSSNVSWNGRHRTDVDRRLRLKADPSVAPRYDDPRCYERLGEGLSAVGASNAIRRLCGLGRHAGGRSCQLLPLTIYDLLVMPKAGKVGKHIPAPNKGSGGDRRMTLIPGDAEMDRIFAWVGGERARLSGMPLAELELIAADPRARKRLKSMPLFTEDGVNFIKYQRLYSVFRRASIRAGLWIDDEEFRETGRKRYITFHYLRHEYVHRRLDEVELIETEREKINGRKAIISYMCWESEAMLNWYSAHHAIKIAFGAAEDHGARLDAGIDARATTPADDWDPRGRAMVDELLDGLS